MSDIATDKKSPPPARSDSASTGQGRANHPRRGSGTVIWIAVLALGVLGAVWWFNHRKAAEAAPPGGATSGRGGGRRGGFGGPNAPLPVGVRPAEKGDINLYLNALGTVTPLHTVTMRSQISGHLDRIAFEEGSEVHKGDLLAVIDSRPYQNTLEQAQGQLRQAQSQLKTAQLDLERYETLAKEDSIAKQQVDTARSQVNQFEGLIQTAQAAIDTANLNINYCHIVAPVDGRVGLRLVDQGNYVTPGDAGGIVVLTQVKPITVLFTLPEDNIAQIAARLRAGAKLPVDAFDRTQSKKIATGTLATLDNQIDTSTGTIRLRAEFANDDEVLFPNQFVNVRLLADTLRDAVVLPTSAIERGPQGAFVYVVKHDDNGDTAAAKALTLGPSEGERIAITSGLAVGEQVVVDGADKLKDGQKVILNAADAAGKQGGGRGGRGGGGSGGEKRKSRGGGAGDGGKQEAGKKDSDSN